MNIVANGRHVRCEESNVAAAQNLQRRVTLLGDTNVTNAKSACNGVYSKHFIGALKYFLHVAARRHRLLHFKTRREKTQKRWQKFEYPATLRALPLRRAARWVTGNFCRADLGKEIKRILGTRRNMRQNNYRMLKMMRQNAQIDSTKSGMRLPMPGIEMRLRKIEVTREMPRIAVAI